MNLSDAEFEKQFMEVYDAAKYKDRGSKKWVAMMLTEHVGLLREYLGDQDKVARPQLEEWDYDAIQECLEMAMKMKSDTKVKLWKDGEFEYKRGTIEGVDLTRRTIELQDPFYLHQIYLGDIVDVTIMD